MNRILCLAVLGALLSAPPAFADYLEVRTAATLKAKPQSDSAIVTRPAVGSLLKLLNTQQSNGYYFAETAAGQQGWIYRTLVRRRAGDIPQQPGGDDILPAPAGTGPTVHSANCLLSCPVGAPVDNDLVTREIYTLSNNGTTKFADWVAYKVTAAGIGPTQQRNWRKDPLLPADKTLEPEDYDDANAVLGTDRGHQAPLASFTSTQFWRDTNLLSNITPQQADLNQGPWERLESAERDLARQSGVEGVYVVTGPLYERMMPRLPQADEPHRVPSGYWKVVAVEQGDGHDVAAFIMEQETARGANFCGQLTGGDEVETRSKLNLFVGLAEAVEEQIESSKGTLAGSLGCAP